MPIKKKTDDPALDADETLDETAESMPSQDSGDGAIIAPDAADPAPDEEEASPGVGGQYISLGGGRVKRA